MNIKDFIANIDSRIRTRGLNYYRSGMIQQVEMIGEGNVLAVVKGNGDYNVNIVLFDQDVLSSSCDCPYDMGGACKHQAAVLYAIKSKGIEAIPKYDLSKILTDLSKEALQKIVLEQAYKDFHLRERLKELNK